VKVRTDEGAKRPVTCRASSLAQRCVRCGVSWHRNPIRTHDRAPYPNGQNYDMGL